MRILVFLLCFLPGLAMAQEEGGNFITRFLENSLSGENRNVSISGFQGALSSRATIGQLTVSDDEGPWLTIRDAVLDWNRSALLRGRIEVSELSAAEIEILRTPGATEGDGPTPEAQPFSLPELPVAIRINALAVDRLHLGAPLVGEEADFTVAGAVQLEGGEGNVSLEIDRIDGPQGRFAIQGQYANTTRQLSLNLDLIEGDGGIVARLIGLPDRPALALTVDGQGTLDDFGADIRLVTDDVERLGGRVTLVTETDAAGQPVRRFATDVSGDIAPLFAPEYREFFGPQITLRSSGLREADGRVVLEDLDLRAQALVLTGNLAIGADGLPERVDITGRISAADGTPVLLPIQPRTEVISADLQLALDGVTDDAWQMRLLVNGLDREDIAFDLLRLTGAGTIRRAGEGTGRRIDGSFAYAAEGIDPRNPALSRALGADIGGDAEVVWEEGADVQLPRFTLGGADYGIEGNAIIAGLEEALRISGQITARAADISRVSDLAGRPLSGSAEVQAEGSFAPLSGEFDVTSAVVGQNLTFDQAELDRLLAGESRINLSALRDTTGITIRSFRAEATTLLAQAEGQIASDSGTINAELDFSDLSVLGGPYGGALSATARLTQEAEGLQRVAMTATGQNLSIGQEQVDALLSGESTIVLVGTRAGDLITLERLQVNAATLAANATGTLQEGASNLAANLDFSDLSVLGGAYGGSLAASAQLTQEAGGPQRVAMTATGQNISIGQDQVDALLSGESTVVLDATRAGDLITLETLRVNAATLAADVTGTLQEGASNLAATLGFSDLSVLGPGFGGALNAQGTLREEGTLRRVALTATANNLAVGQAQVNTLLRGQTQLALEATEDAGAVLVQSFNLSNPQLSAQASGAVEGDSRRVNLTARLANLGLLLPEFSGPVTAEGTITQNGAYGINITAQGPGGINATVSGTAATDFSTLDLGITGSAQSALANLFIEPRSVAGPLNFNLRLNGAPALSSLSGSVTGQGLRLVDPELGIALDQGTLRADLSGGRAALSASAAFDGGGQVLLNGPIGLEPPFQADLTVGLREVALSDPELYETTVNGDVRINGPLTGGGNIAGALQLGVTNLRIPSTGFGGAGYIPDEITHLNEPAAVRETRARAGLLGDGTGAGGAGGGGGAAPFGLNITISAPNQVFIRGRGLDAELGGQIQLTGTTANVVPIGEFSLIRGRLDLLGRRFTLDEGLAQLRGAFVPWIRLSASTVAEGVTATILIEGEANEPEISFISSPELPEEEVLARLLFGRGLTNLTALQAAQLASAVATLAGRGGEGIVGRLRQGFGLDDLDITTNEEGEAGVRLGRYLTDNIYTDVTVGAGGSTEINLNLDVSPSVTVRGRLDNEGQTGVGIYFERDY